MIEALLPDGVSCAEAREDPPGARLFPEEEAVVARAVEKRRREFTTGRSCARRALAQLGFAPCPIPSGSRGEPRWPDGAVGSITHCEGYRACAAARSETAAAVAIDAEPHAPLPAGLLADVATAPERAALRELARAQPAVHWGRLLFSAKESVFKAWWPLTELPLEFEQATIAFDLHRGGFRAQLAASAPSPGPPRPRAFEGRWAVHEGLILTAIVVSRPLPAGE